MWNFWQKRNTLNFLLAPVSFLFLLVVQIRKGLYQIQFLNQKKINTPIVVVGNITAGGNKKSSFVLELANILNLSGIKVGVISRGYKSQAEKENTIIEVQEQSDVSECGDEPLMIKQSNPNLSVFVGKNRFLAADSCAKNGVDIIISDDGLQHYKLSRDLEIVLNDKNHNGFMLPAGPLREPICRLKTVDFVLDTSNLIYKPLFWQNCFDETKADLNLNSFFSDKKQKLYFYGFSALAKNHQFKNSVENLGIKLDDWKFFKDHHHYQKDDFKGFKQPCIFLTTHKDAVKLKKDWFNKNQHCYYLKSELLIDSADLSKIVEKIKGLIFHYQNKSK